MFLHTHFHLQLLLTRRAQGRILGTFQKKHCSFGKRRAMDKQYFHLFFLFNPLNEDLNPICHLLALLGAHHILHVSRIRVKWHFLALLGAHHILHVSRIRVKRLIYHSFTVHKKSVFEHRTQWTLLISKFRRVLNVVCFLLGNSRASDFYMQSFRNTLSVPSS